MDNEKKVGHSFYSHGFTRAYRYVEGGTEQIGSTAVTDDEQLNEFHARMCAILGPDVREWFGSYYAKG